jgi:hypothetical protein
LTKDQVRERAKQASEDAAKKKQEKAAEEKQRKADAEAQRKAEAEAKQQAAELADRFATNLQSLITSPDAWLKGGKLYELASTIAKIRTDSDLEQLVPKLKQLGIYDPQTINQVRRDLVSNAAGGYAASLLYDAAVDKAIERLQQKGLVKDSNQWMNPVVLHSVAATAFNMATVNLPGQIVGQTTQVVSQAMALRNETGSLVNAFVQQGAADIRALQIAKSVSPPEAERIRSAVGSSIQTTTVVMDQLSKGSPIPLQTAASNKWTIIKALINAKQVQLQGNELEASKATADIKQLAISLDKADGTYNNPASPLNNQYQKFANDVATSEGYGLPGW